MSEHSTHNHSPEHAPVGNRTEARIAAGIEHAELSGTEIDEGTARRIARILSRATGSDSALATFAETGVGTYEQLRDEYLAIYRADDAPDEARRWIDWLGTHLVRRENDSWIAKPLPHPLDQVRVFTTTTIGDEHIIFRVPGTASSADIATTVELLHELQVDQDDALQAYLTLPDVNAMQNNLMESFHENFAGTYVDHETALRALSPLSEWESELVDWCIDHGIEFDALHWNLEPLTSRLAEIYDLIELKGRIHAFIK